MKYSLGISNFLEEISSLSHLAFLNFFALITEESFLISPCYSFAFKWVYLRFSPFLLCFDLDLGRAKTWAAAADFATIKVWLSEYFQSRFQIVIQLLSHVCFFVTPWTTIHQASLSFPISWSLLKLLSIELVMPSNHLILCCPFLLPSVFPTIGAFSNELALCIIWPKYWSFSFSISP